MFLLVYHVPVLCGIGLLMTVLRVVGIGDLPAVGLLPLSMLLFVGPLAELAVGLLVGRVERRAAWCAASASCPPSRCRSGSPPAPTSTACSAARTPG